MARVFAIVPAALAAGLLALACAFHDWSGMTLDDRGRILAVNNRPGAVGLCEDSGEELVCTPLPFEMRNYSRYDFEGIAWVGPELFYVVSEKRDNRCMADCRLSQDVMAFRINARGEVAAAACGTVTIPLLRGDNPRCPYANCGLEGIAYDARRRMLYVAKEAEQPRLFALPLNEDLCPTGQIAPLRPPVALSSYNGLAFSQARDSLFILSTRAARLYEWRLSDNRIVLRSEDIPALHHFLTTVPIVEAVTVDDAAQRLYLASERGRFLSVPLPPPPPLENGDGRLAGGVGRLEWR